VIARVLIGVFLFLNLVVFAWGMWGQVMPVHAIQAGGVRSDLIAIQTPWIPEKPDQTPVEVSATKIDLKQGQQQLDQVIQTAGQQVVNGEPVNQQCRLWGPFVGGDAERIADALKAWGGQVQRVKRPVPVGYVVYLPKEKVGPDTVKELAAKGIREVFLITSPGPLQGTISLGLFRDMERARVQKAEVEDRGFEGVGIRERLGATRIFFELKGSPAQATALKTIYGLNPRGGITVCSEEE
jgi:hypothetical protein